MENVFKQKSLGGWLRRVVAVLVLNLGITGLSAQTSDALLNLFIQKGFVTKQEAEMVKAEAEAMQTNNVAIASAPAPESIWKVNKAIKSVELFGDIRLRYENRTAEDPSGGEIDLQQFRYSVRLGLRGEVFDDYYYGVRIDTSLNARSTWNTFGSSANAPFGKTANGIGIGQVYLGWRPTDWADLTAGKMANPFFTTSMVWDGDINPEGFAERFKFTVGQADLFATFGQFLYQDTNPNQASKGYFNLDYNSANMPFLLGWQLGVNYHLTKTLDFKIAPVLYNYTASGANNGANIYSPGFPGDFIGQGTTQGVGGTPAYYNLGNNNGFFANATGINDLLVIQVPWELNLRLEKHSLRLFGDYAQNLNGSDRANAAYVAQQDPLFNGSGIILIPSPQTQDNKAYQFGFAIGNRDSLGLVNGSAYKKNAWEFRTYWQHIEQYALDPNLLDSDFFEGRGNLEGVYVALAYGLTGNMTTTFRYGYASRINNNLGTGGSNLSIPQMNPIEHFNLIQFDLAFKF